MPTYGVSADHIAAQGGGFEPQRKNNFTIDIPVGSGVIQLSLHSAKLPDTSNNAITIKFGNEERHVPGRTKVSSFRAVIKDFVSGQVLAALKEWRKQVYDSSNGRIGLASQYKKQCTVRLFGPDGSSERTWTLVGCWPSEYDPGSGDMTSNTQNLIELEIECDKAFMNSTG